MKNRIKVWQIIVAAPIILFSVIMIVSGFSLISDGKTGSGIFGILFGFFCLLPAAAVLILPLVLKKNRKAAADPKEAHIEPPVPAASDNNRPIISETPHQGGDTIAHTTADQKPTIRRIESDGFYDYSKLRVDASSIVPTVDVVDTRNPIYGKHIVFTGELLRMSREEAVQYVVNHGGTSGNSVTKNTAFLVIGDAGFPSNTASDGSGKMKKAEEWRSRGSAIQMISEDDFFKMMSDYEETKGN
ncbi:MAG: BRCT domain-containing protein [Clostridia bacterium]|nr:BRCT domain-containing protein [Clostridia bacterium]